MDTISRDSNTSYAPIAAVIVGLLALVLSIVCLVKISKINSSVAEVKTLSETAGTDARSAVSTAESARTSVTTLATQTQRAFDTVTAELGNLRTSVNKLETAPAPRASSSGSSSAASATAEPGTYIVKSGDTGVKIAKAAGVSLSDLMGANPDVDWNRLKVGQKLRLPGGR
jgi:LysM repeat protein